MAFVGKVINQFYNFLLNSDLYKLNYLNTKSELETQFLFVCSPTVIFYRIYIECLICRCDDRR